jgi:hypothetical protein
MTRALTPRAAAAAAWLSLAAWSVQAATGSDPSTIEPPTGENGPITREQVRAELAQWRSAGLMDQGGEIGAAPEVLAAREDHNEKIAVAIYARLEREQQVQLAAAEAQRQAEARAAAAAAAAVVASSESTGADGGERGAASTDDASIVASEMPLTAAESLDKNEALVTSGTPDPADSQPKDREARIDAVDRREEPR